MIRTLALVLAAGLAGCSSFVPVERSALAPGDAIRLELTSAESARQVDNLGAYREAVQGTVVDLEDDAVGITVSAVQAEGAPIRRNLRSYLAISWEGVREVEKSQFNWARTALVAAGGALAAWGLLELTTGSAGSGEEPPINNQRAGLSLLRLIF